MQSNTSANHSHMIIVRLTHHLVKYSCYQSLVPFFAGLYHHRRVHQYLGDAHFKLLIWGVDDSSVWSAGADETDPLERKRTL